MNLKRTLEYLTSKQP